MLMTQNIMNNLQLMNGLAAQQNMQSVLGNEQIALEAQSKR